ncbi:Uncharacterized protein TCM_029846 [Theobroma cacao]|uniref:Uncharacterized protein n=1 Tax=Theobroma cacao TaxID=3641 RepID=A0A061GED8_THECC|nr:Uncharacterized protein TCM_029846 [Theobroma cacao]
MAKAALRLAVKERVDNWARNLDSFVLFFLCEGKKGCQGRQAILTSTVSTSSNCGLGCSMQQFIVYHLGLVGRSTIRGHYGKNVTIGYEMGPIQSCHLMQLFNTEKF